MNDQVEDTVEEEVEIDEVEEDVLDADEDDIDTDDDDSDDDDDDSEDVEVDGEKYRIPKKLKQNMLMQADYTRKTQEVAEQRRATEAEIEQHQQQVQRFQQHQEKYAELHAIEKQIAQYKQVDWATLRQQDFVMAQQHRDNFDTLKEEAQEKAQELNQLTEQSSRQQQATLAKRKSEVVARLSKEIEGWSGEGAQKVVSAARGEGFSNQFLKAVNEAVFPDTVPMVKVLHKSALYDEIIAKSKKVGKGDSKAAPVIPTKKVTGKQTARKSIYDPKLTTEQRISLRNKQRERARAK
jgi:hypothetical protein